MPARPNTPFTPQEALEFMQRMWNPFGMPIPAFTPPGTAAGSMPFPNPATMFAALDPAEIDKKIAELKVIENWLAMSQNLLQMSIKTMELQKASLEAMRAGVGTADPPRKKSRNQSDGE